VRGQDELSPWHRQSIQGMLDIERAEGLLPICWYPLQDVTQV
jgi:hypothetical protein